jgi:hypothetical protein
MARGGARPGAGRPAGKSANTSPPSPRARARARGGSENQRPWPADKVERWSIDRLIPYAKNARTHSDAQIAAIAAGRVRDSGRATARAVPWHALFEAERPQLVQITGPFDGFHATQAYSWTTWSRSRKTSKGIGSSRWSS